MRTFIIVRERRGHSSRTFCAPRCLHTDSDRGADKGKKGGHTSKRERKIIHAYTHARKTRTRARTHKEGFKSLPTVFGTYPPRSAERPRRVPPTFPYEKILRANFKKLPKNA